MASRYVKSPEEKGIKKGAPALSIIEKKEEEKDRITAMHGTSTLIFGPIKF